MEDNKMSINELSNVLLRITGRAILTRMTESKSTFDEIIKLYPKLTKEQIEILKECEEFQGFDSGDK
jgi:hypothetical protein